MGVDVTLIMSCEPQDETWHVLFQRKATLPFAPFYGLVLDVCGCCDGTCIGDDDEILLDVTTGECRVMFSRKTHKYTMQQAIKHYGSKGWCVIDTDEMTTSVEKL